MVTDTIEFDSILIMESVNFNKKLDPERLNRNHQENTLNCTGISQIVILSLATINE